MAIWYEFQLFFLSTVIKKSSSTNTATSFTCCSIDGPDQLISQPQGLPETLGYRLLFVDQSGNKHQTSHSMILRNKGSMKLSHSKKFKVKSLSSRLLLKDFMLRLYFLRMTCYLAI